MARRGTTPDYILQIPNVDLTRRSVFVTISQFTPILTLTGDRLEITYDSATDVSEVAFRLSQEETLAMRTGEAEIQARWIGEDGLADATTVEKINISPVLNEDVIEHDG